MVELIYIDGACRTGRWVSAADVYRPLTPSHSEQNKLHPVLLRMTCISIDTSQFFALSTRRLTGPRLMFSKVDLTLNCLIPWTPGEGLSSYIDQLLATYPSGGVWLTPSEQKRNPIWARKSEIWDPNLDKRLRPTVYFESSWEFWLRWLNWSPPFFVVHWLTSFAGGLVNRRDVFVCIGAKCLRPIWAWVLYMFVLAARFLSTIEGCAWYVQYSR
jgi:hypothetical protein